MITYIIMDMMEPIGYMPAGLLAGCVFLAVLKILEKGLGQSPKRNRLFREVVYFCTVIYVSVVLKLAFFSREPGSRKGLDLILFSSWNEGVRGQVFFIENVLMFIPLGILFPFIVPGLQKGRNCVLFGLVCSVLLEGMQLVTQRGYCQLDDVVTNTAGALIGWMIFRSVKIVSGKIRRRKLDRTCV